MFCKVIVQLATFSLLAIQETWGGTDVLNVNTTSLIRPLQQVCYDNYGCFSNEYPWTSLHRPLTFVPEQPYKIGARFLIFTRENADYGYELVPFKKGVLKFSPFSAERKTNILIHGFTDSHRTDYVWEAKNYLLKNSDCNVILVDWAPGARPPYLRATASIRVVGAQTASLIEFLEENAGLSINDIHIIGYSLGAHCAGYVGERLKGQIPHITALDPNDPYFGGTDPIVRLDTTDAKFVEVIHTNGNGVFNFGFGILDSIGHVDIFANGGKKQPGCHDVFGSLIGSILEFITLDIKGALSEWACSHARAGALYAEKVLQESTCPFMAFSCDSYSDFEKGRCFSDCSKDGDCFALGRISNARGNFYQTTGSGEENTLRCLQSVTVSMLVNINQETAKGEIDISFRSLDGAVSPKEKIIDGEMKSGQIITTWIQVPSSILSSHAPELPIVLRYKRGGLFPLFQPKTLALEEISVSVLTTDYELKKVSYGSATLQTGVDLQLSP